MALDTAKPNHVQTVMFDENGNKIAEKSREGGGGNVEKYFPISIQAIETAINCLSPDHLKHLDKEVNRLILTRVAGLLRLQLYPAVANKRHRRSLDQRGRV